ncbi:MAG: hypothetical protein AAFZ07_14580 [Actinomycetota bacterium]
MSDTPLALEAGPQRAQPRTVLIGTALVSIGVIVAFGLLLGVYAQMRHDAGGTTDAWVPGGVEFRNAQLVFTLLTLVIGSASIQWAVQASNAIDVVNARIALSLTVVLGLLHINMTLFAVDAFGVGVGEVWSNLVFTITGAAIGLSGVATAFVLVAALKAFGGQVGISNPTIPAAALFWHVQVAVWFVVFLAIFAIK